MRNLWIGSRDRVMHVGVICDFQSQGQHRVIIEEQQALQVG